MTYLALNNIEIAMPFLQHRKVSSILDLERSKSGNKREYNVSYQARMLY